MIAAANGSFPGTGAVGVSPIGACEEDPNVLVNSPIASGFAGAAAGTVGFAGGAAADAWGSPIGVFEGTPKICVNPPVSATAGALPTGGCGAVVFAAVPVEKRSMIL